jgi:uncharacterized membrane protein YphA (DoxX/SURF4 family)
MAATLTTHPAPPPTDIGSSSGHRLSDPVYQAFWLLRLGFFLLPVVFGIDKFFNWLTFWPKYLWIGFPHLLSVSPQHFMYVVGGVEIAAGLLVLLLPRIAPYVVVAWLAGIITNLVIISAAPGHAAYWDIAFRDFGLLIGALALGRLAAGVQPKAARTIGER